MDKQKKFSKMGAVAIVVALCFVATATVNGINVEQSTNMEKASSQIMGINAPSKPATPEAQFEGYLGSGQEGSFITSATCDNPIEFLWDWGNGDFTTSLAVESGEECLESHAWTVQPQLHGDIYGLFYVKVQAKNIVTEELSEWSDSCLVVVKAPIIVSPDFVLIAEEAALLTVGESVYTIHISDYVLA